MRHLQRCSCRAGLLADWSSVSLGGASGWFRDGGGSKNRLTLLRLCEEVRARKWGNTWVQVRVHGFVYVASNSGPGDITTSLTIIEITRDCGNIANRSKGLFFVSLKWISASCQEHRGNTVSVLTLSEPHLSQKTFPLHRSPMWRF